ncbi:hypothetical protein HCJ52_13795 [Listeria sp. FSL L7-1485]|uniref:Uncharacterized protein n=1 Tax=Listeria immobilis TaxID=2713502 RepID=A0ABR6SZV5_9LIST|nr:hypothetical protein [Listeria immobilis]MBC1483967.1 hypothetical protein [Listeria immobilis]MBC1508188.1 hypothetical protein [Listeria immobilis]MBC1511204.1 hypothetical protein [Listeria immobilis]MBC1537189.1 hypothetical protein [Listeria immobilis]MBC6313943.1 hypothetical protein [Listeria immobilis]
MQNNIFNSIRLGIIAWLDSNIESIEENDIKVTIIKNEKDGYVVEFDNDICMAEIVVEEATYAPYRYVSFEVVSVVDSKVKIIYSWYDDDTSMLTDIEKELDKGIQFLANNE